jgi:hypothetical protein
MHARKANCTKIIEVAGFLTLELINHVLLKKGKNMIYDIFVNSIWVVTRWQ